MSFSFRPMADSDGPVVARAVYKALHRVFRANSMIRSNAIEALEKLRDVPEVERLEAISEIKENMQKAIHAALEVYPPSRMLFPFSLAEVLDDLVREVFCSLE